MTDPYESDVGLIDTVPLEPPGAYPDSATDCGVFVAESLNSNAAVRVPPVVGAKVMFAVQLLPAARLVPHVFEKMRKSPGSAPPIVRPLIEIALVPLFVSVATFWPPTLPTLTEAQLSELGLADAVPPVVVVEEPPGAYPFRATSCGLGLAESLNSSAADRVPLTVGLNVMFAVQLAPGERFVPQVLEKILKS